MTASNTANVVASETLAVPVSRFMHAQLARFTRSHSSLYMALILDVIHGHNAILPRGYAKSLAEVAPTFADMLPKYCTVVAPALASIHAPTIAGFAATAEGVADAVKWLENQSSIGGYTLSLEDTKRFLKGEWSVKAQAEQKAKDAASRQAEIIATAVTATADKQATADASNKRSKAMQSGLESELSNMPHNVVAIRDIEPGTLLNDDWAVSLVTVHTKGEAVKVTGLEALSPETLLSLIEQANALMMAALEIKTGT